ncbi:glycoside hydrolase family 5 protein [Mycena floridula]|nr:glycoside hydrolase family 5 protein [Mycena floridula]
MLASLVALLVISVVSGTAQVQLPAKIYGVNLGSWLVLEPWMLPQEWMDMGGEDCDDCSKCIRSESALTQAYPYAADELFNRHWSTWFTQDDVDQLKYLGINAVRIPLGFWIIEALVDRKTEFFPRGGLQQLRRGLQQLKDAGIAVILDHHALPGIQSPNQMFTGLCTNDVLFYTEANYHRALIWTAVMTVFSHLDPAFQSVAAIQAVNEPIMDAHLTPGYGQFQVDFVQTVRAVEFACGLPYHGEPGFKTSNITQAFLNLTESTIFNEEVRSVLADSIPILQGQSIHMTTVRGQRVPLTTVFMDVNWQYNNPANPSKAMDGPQTYDNHLYYNFGGVADATPKAYMKSICNLQRVQNDAAVGDSPLWFGEWGLPTQFSATDAFLMQWADAQKLASNLFRHSNFKSQFWNFKIENSERAQNLSRQWSYIDGVKLGYLTVDPSKLHDEHVCDKYR